MVEWDEGREITCVLHICCKVNGSLPVGQGMGTFGIIVLIYDANV